MSNPTTPFSWQMPTATDLVTDLPADFEVFGQAVATSMADLLGGTSGQVLAKNSNTDMDFTWVSANPGDISAVNVTSPITGGGSSGDVTIAIQDASTSQKGSVQLSDSTSTTSSVLAATPTAVKASYDLAAAAIPKSTVTTAGDLIYASGANTPARLGIGSSAQVLTVASGVPSWATPATPSSAKSFALLSSTSLSGGTYTISGLSGYDQFQFLLAGVSNSAGGYINIRFNTDTGANYNYYGGSLYSGNTWSPTNFYPGNGAGDNKIPGLGNTGAAGNGTIGMFMTGGNTSGVKQFMMNSSFSTTGSYGYNVHGTYTGAAVISSISIVNASGTFDAGTLEIYGAA